MKFLRVLRRLALLSVLLLAWRYVIWPRLPQAMPPAVTITSSSASASSASSSTAETTTATPVESIVQGLDLANTYHYHFAANTPATVKTLFTQAIADYNRTGIVKLVPGVADNSQNGITFGVYRKQMPANTTSFELGKGGPAITQRFGAVNSTINHAQAQLNLTYTGQLSRSVALHELGHALGLDHSPATSSIMYPVDTGVTQLSAADLNGLRQIYPAK